MREAHGRRAILERRIRVGNGLANFFGLLTVLCGVMAASGRHVDRWLIAGTFVAAACVTAIRVVTASRIEHYQLGAPGPHLVVESSPPDDMTPP